MSSEEIIKMLMQQVKEQSETIDNLRRAAEESNQTIKGLKDTIDALNQTIKELTEKLGMNSKNSSKPPSTDGFNRPSPKSLRTPSGKKPGGQSGHSGSHFDVTREPDEIILHAPTACKGCPAYESCVSRACIGETRKVIDAVVTVNFTAHQALVFDCPLHGGQRKGEFPSEIKAPVQYGENLQALVVALNTIGAVSVNRTHEILSSVFDIPLSTGTVSNMVGRCADWITGTVESIRRKMAASELGHFDETGTRVDGKTIWVHNASNSEYTYLTVSEKRGKDGMDEGRVLPHFTGKAVHDCWAPYWKFKLIIHAICCVHILRELVGVVDNHPEQTWATAFIELLLDMKEAKEAAISNDRERLSAECLSFYEAVYDQIIAKAYDENPLPEIKEKKRGRIKKGKVRALIERLDNYKASVCLFARDFSVPFDNNLAERDIRMVKTKTKVSGCFRSMDGARDFLKIMSYVGTAKKQSISPYEAIRQAILGNSNYIFAETN